MSTPTTLSPSTDPASLSKLRILVIPIRRSSVALTGHTYGFWCGLIKRHTVLRGDELKRTTSTNLHSHSRSSTNPSTDPRNRFLPASHGTSISRGGASNHVHLEYLAAPPAKHLGGISLLRLAAFPLIVIGIAVDSQPEDEDGNVQGYSVEEENSGDIGESSTPTVATFQHPITPSTSTSSPESAFSDTISSLFPLTSPFPLVRRLVLVPPTAPTSPSPRSTPRKNRTPRFEGGTKDGKDKAEGREVIRPPSEGLHAWMGSMLGDVVADVLGELGDLATALETTAGLKTLSSTLLPSLTSALPLPDNIFPDQPTTSTPTSDLPRRPSTVTPVSTLSQSQSVDRLGSQSGVGISLKRALTPGGRPTSVGPPALPPIQSSAVAPPSAPIPQSSSSNPFRRSSALAFSRSSSSQSINSTLSSNTSSPVATTGTKYTSAPLTGLAAGRLLKLIGDMYLLAGMYGDAIQCYDDGAERCRVVGDVLWEAVAREGRAVAGIGEAWEGRDGSNMTQPFPTSPIPVEILTHFLSALACLSRSPLPYPQTILSPSPQAVSGTISFSAPSASDPSAVGTGEGLLAYLYTSLALRISHFLLIVWAARGWGSIALSALLSHSLPRSFPLALSSEEARDSAARRKRRRTLLMLSSKSQLERHSIFGHAETALAPHHRSMTKAEQLAVHVEVAWLARWLDLPRREVYVTREVVKRIGSMIVEGRDEQRRLESAGFSRRAKDDSTDTHTPSTGLGLGLPIKKQVVGIRRRESVEGNNGVMALFERAVGLMGLDLLTMSSSSAKRVSILGSENEDTPAPRFGWPDLQMEMIKEGIAIAEALPDQLEVIRLCTSALNCLYTRFNGPNQVQIAKMSSGALATVRRRGMDFGGLPWWIPGKIVLSIELASLPPNRLPLEHSREEIVPKEGKRDPFLYNPRTKAVGAGKTVLVANEQIEVYATLRNPFAFDLEVQDVSVITSGVPFTTTPLPLSLPPNSVQTVRVNGVASTPGALQIRGVTMRLPDGSSTDILLPMFNDADRQKRDKRRSRFVAESSKIKRQGADARWSITTPESARSSVQMDGGEMWLECKVVEEQPLVWIKKTSLTHGTVMLYNGETSMIRITLENSSSTPVDFIKLSFDDSTLRDAQLVLSEGELSPEAAYEREWDIINRPVFSWESDAEMSIPPGGRTTVTVKCLGKVGCTDGSIRIDYGCLGRDKRDTLPSIFHTRQITFPVLFTVYHTLDPHSLDLIRLSPSSSKDTTQSMSNGFLPIPNGDLSSRRSSGAITPRSPGFPTIGDALLTERMAVEMDEKHCLLGLSVRNVYGVPFEVTIARKAEQGDGVSATRLVPPGATERLLLPLPRLSLPKPTLSRPVPALSEKQYVVDKTKKTAEQIGAERERFWYREELLKSLVATWIEPGSRRSGTMSLRDQMLGPSLLEVLQMDELEISVSATPKTGKTVRASEIVDLRVSITNHLERDVRPHVRLESLPSSSLDTSWASAASTRRSQQQLQPTTPLRNILFDGVVSRTLDSLPPGQTIIHMVRVVFLATGTYGFRAAVEEVDLSSTKSIHDAPRVRFSPLLHVTVS